MIDYRAFLSRAGLNMQGSAIRRTSTLTAGVPDLISFAPGYPDPAVFAWAEYRDIAADILDGTDGDTLQYGPTRGYEPLVNALPEILAARGITATTEEMLVTTGSQQGLDLLARTLFDPGDVVLVELPVFTGAIAAFRDSGAALAGVRQDAGGIDLDDLDAVVRRERQAGHRVRCVYVVPNFQNPTGRLMSLARRRGLLELAETHDLLILEDDPYGDLYFDDGDAPLTRPLKADDREGRVVYLSSVSKTLAPGFRTAWITAAPPLAAKLDTAKQAADLCTSSLDQRMVYEAWKRGVLARGIPVLRAHYGRKRDAMSRALQRDLGGVVTWLDARGGFFMWVELPARLDAERLLPAAVQERVAYVPGAPFFVDGSGRHTLRLSFALPTPERIDDGVGRLARVVRRALGGVR